MSKLSKDVKRSKSVQIAAFIGAKKKPRGRSFVKGNQIGAEHRFQKGQSALNPAGRPRCKEISKALRERLASEKPIPAKTGAEKIAKEWFEQGLSGNVAAMVSLADRVEGRPAVTIVGDGREDNLTLLIAGMEGISRQIGPPERPQLEEHNDED
jgi:hypothetical protein